MMSNNFYNKLRFNGFISDIFRDIFRDNFILYVQG